MDVKSKRRRSRIWLRRLMAVVVLAAIFMLGFSVGNGRISFSRHQTVVSGNLPTRLNYKTVDQVYKSLRENYDGKLTESQQTDGLKHGLAASTKDPYTVYFTPKEAKDFNSQLNNSFSGIGAQL